MSSAGQLLVAGRIPGERIAFVEATADSSNFTSETVVMTVVAPMVINRRYSVFCTVGLMSSANGDVVRAQLREDNLAGNPLDAAIDEVTDNTNQTTRKKCLVLLSDYVAVATGNKTFVVTGERPTGTGNTRLEGAASRKSYIIVRYESG